MGLTFDGHCKEDASQNIQVLFACALGLFLTQATRMLRIKRNSGKCMHLFLALFVIFQCRLVSVLSYFVPLDVEIIEQTKVLFLLWTRMSHYLCQKKKHDWCHGTFSHFTGSVQIFSFVGKTHKNCFLYRYWPFRTIWWLKLFVHCFL